MNNENHVVYAFLRGNTAANAPIEFFWQEKRMSDYCCQRKK